MPLEGSNELDNCSSTNWSSLVMLSAAKHLVADRDRPVAEFTLSVTNVLNVTQCDRSKGLLHLEPYCESRVALRR